MLRLGLEYELDSLKTLSLLLYCCDTTILTYNFGANQYLFFTYVSLNRMADEGVKPYTAALPTGRVTNRFSRYSFIDQAPIYKLHKELNTFILAADL